ncbi:hypothetical protein D3C85_1428310 [compost metagenome]
MSHLGNFSHRELAQFFCERFVGLNNLIVVTTNLVEEAINCTQLQFTLARLGQEVSEGLLRPSAPSVYLGLCIFE